MIERVLIANRGEIACRIIRGCHDLGVETVAVYSEADSRALHVKLAGRSVLLGPAPPAESYLNQEKIIAAARELKCDAIHPGYGFLAENAEFARAVAAAGLTWIGPPPEAINSMGLKIEARQLAKAAGAPVIPGFESSEATMAEFQSAAEEIGYPVMVKASAGGGGKGMRMVHDPAKLEAAVEAARREAEKAFGNPTVFLEKLIVRPRHIEIQVLADHHGNVIHLGERECSIQRRHQKVVEETPSVAVTPELRAQMGESAVSIARQVGYCNAGTVEFIADEDGNYYFLEMNTRLQVEHPVTELVYGVDLVEWQLRIASGEKLELAQEGIVPRGHAIECRVCAEDPGAGFLPQVGSAAVYREPRGPGVRVDTMLYPGLDVGADYDSLLSKLIVWGSTREAAIRKMGHALSEYRVLGLTTNLPFLYDVITHPAFAAGDTTTDFIPEHIGEWSPPDIPLPHQLAACIAAAAGTRQAAPQPQEGSAEIPTPWQAAGAWSNT